MTNMENMTRQQVETGLPDRKVAKKCCPMTTFKPNCFLTRALLILCCAGALAACPVWATVARPATELDEAMARTGFEEQSAPSVQFASVPRGSTDVSVVSTANVGVVPVPEMSALFPIVGLIVAVSCTQILRRRRAAQDRKSTRLNSSHEWISYAVFCLKKKKKLVKDTYSHSHKYAVDLVACYHRRRYRLRAR